MPTYLGSGGFIELKRTSMEHSLNVSMVPGDVNTTRKRFSVTDAKKNIITGDRLQIKRIDGSANLELVSGHTGRDGSWFVHVDDIGGMRLYETFALAVGGTKVNALSLVTPTEIAPEEYDTETSFTSSEFSRETVIPSDIAYETVTEDVSAPVRSVSDSALIVISPIA